MSDYERNKGRLIPTGEAAEQICEREGWEVLYGDPRDTLLGRYYDGAEYAEIGGTWYRVERDETGDGPEFAEVAPNEDGSLSFHTYHYNGGGTWTELVEEEMGRHPELHPSRSDAGEFRGSERDGVRPVAPPKEDGTYRIKVRLPGGSTVECVARYSAMTGHWLAGGRQVGFADRITPEGCGDEGELVGWERDGFGRVGELLEAIARAADLAHPEAAICGASPDCLDAIDRIQKALPLEMPPTLIGGLLRRGGKMVLGGASKSRKSWTLIQLAVSLANGLDFLGFECRKSRVLLVNLELMEAEMQTRLLDVSEAMAAGVEGLALLNLRGHAAGLEVLAPSITAAAESSKADIIILDPIYKVLGDRVENANEGVADLLNVVDTIAERSGAAVVFAHHFAKGAQGGKFAEDRISGAGAWWRDPDAGMFITALEEEGGFQVSAKARSFAPVGDFAIRTQHPLMVVADDLDPADVKKPGGRQKLSSAEEVASVLTEPMARGKWREATGLSEGTFTRRQREAESTGLVVNRSGLWMRKEDADELLQN